jgi:hypothetical protein
MSPKEDIAVRTEMRCTLASAQVAMGQFAAGAETARGALTDGGADSHALVRLRCAMVLARALKGAKAPEAEAARAQARGSLELFTANWPDEFRRLFLNRQDIRRYFNEEK